MTYTWLTTSLSLTPPIPEITWISFGNTFTWESLPEDVFENLINGEDKLELVESILSAVTPPLHAKSQAAGKPPVVPNEATCFNVSLSIPFSWFVSFILTTTFLTNAPKVTVISTWPTFNAFTLPSWSTLAIYSDPLE